MMLTSSFAYTRQRVTLSTAAGRTNTENLPGAGMGVLLCEISHDLCNPRQKAPQKASGTHSAPRDLSSIMQMLSSARGCTIAAFCKALLLETWKATKLREPIFFLIMMYLVTTMVLESSSSSSRAATDMPTQKPLVGFLCGFLKGILTCDFSTWTIEAAVRSSGSSSALQ